MNDANLPAAGSAPTPANGGGWTCPLCNVFVSLAQSHACNHYHAGIPVGENVVSNTCVQPLTDRIARLERIVFGALATYARDHGITEGAAEQILTNNHRQSIEQGIEQERMEYAQQAKSELEKP